ncbi:beta strand repeat-containing protein [Bartonella schoenbuchensis]|uniref:beta strand repeat-containing protein n=1 Tax=Bartonella schoenbuchensis TaxID=165694 RepID=UPI003144E6FF
MVMRRVFNHHVCLCVLSTAILAGLALMTSQTKVYAQAQNCKGLANSGDGDVSSGLIVCDGGAEGTGGSNGELTGNRDIDMSKYSGKAAVTVTGANTKITIKSKLTVTDKSGNDTTAIKVYDGGVLKLVGDVSIAGVQKGIVVEGPSSSVTVVQGKIGVKAGGGGSLIEVKNSGKVVLMEGVTVGTISGNNAGEVVINNGGDVMLMGTRFNNVKTGIVVKGTTGMANVKGKATINLASSGGTGFKMEGQANADVMELEIKGSGGKGTGAEVSSGTLKMTRVTLKDLATGAKVTGRGTLKLEGSSTINVAAGGKGLEVLSGTANVTSTTITLQGDGKGFKVEGAGKATVVSTTIKGDGKGMGVEMEESADVTLTNVTMSQVATGVEMKGTGGVLTVNGKSKIHVVGGGTGLNIAGSGTVTMNGTEIMAGGTGTGLKVGGRANVTLTSVTMKDVKTGITKGGSGTLTLNGTTTINVGQNGTGMSVTGGNVVMTGTLTITGSGTTGMSVSNGTVTMEGKTMINVAAGGTGMSVGGSDAMVMMSGTTMINVGQNGTGMNVTDGTVMMKGTTINVVGVGKGTTGVSVSGGDVTMERVNISQVETGIKMEGSGSLTVREGTIVGRGRGVGISATGGNGNVTVEGVNISNFATGVEMGGTGTLTVGEGTKIQFTAEGTGVKVGKEVQSTTLTDVTISGRGSGSKGVWVEGGAVVMERVGISMKGGTGVMVEEGVTRTSLTGVMITGVERGIAMMGSGEFTVSGTTIQFTGEDGYGYGVYAGSSVTRTELTGVTITGNGGSESKGVWLKGGEVVMNTVGISGVTTGVLMEKGESLTVSGGSIGFTGTYGIKVGSSVKSTELTGVTITGNGVGVYAEGGNLTVSGGSITGVEAGIYMEGSGTLTVRDKTRIEFKADGYGVYAGGSVTKATLMGTVISGDGKGYGVLMTGSTGTLTMERVGISNVERGIWVTGGTLIMKEGTKIGFTKDYGIKLGKGVTSATLTKVEIVGSNKGKGVVWESAGTLTLDEVKMLKVATGVEMKKGTLIMNEGTTINFMGDYGVMVGKGVTKATLTDVKIAGRGKTGVLMGSTGTLTRVNISGVQTGVEVTGKGTLTMMDGEIQFTEVGLKVEGETTATATVTGTKIVGSGNNGMGTIRGIYVGNSKAVTLEKVDVSGVTTGVEMRAGESLTVKEGKIEFMGIYGVMVGKEVKNAELTGVEIKGNKSGTGVEMRGKTMTMTRVNVSQVETGIYATGGNLTVIGGEIKEVEKGITMMGYGVLKVKDNTRIEFTKDYGIKLGGKVGALVTNVEITGSNNDLGKIV